MFVQFARVSPFIAGSRKPDKAKAAAGQQAPFAGKACRKGRPAKMKPDPAFKRGGASRNHCAFCLISICNHFGTGQPRPRIHAASGAHLRT
eukprot:8820173-Lingulodinium_polyedra.AAC.1